MRHPRRWYRRTHEQHRDSRKRFQESQQRSKESCVIAVDLIEDQSARGNGWKGEHRAPVVLHEPQNSVHGADNNLSVPSLEGFKPETFFHGIFITCTLHLAYI